MMVHGYALFPFSLVLLVVFVMILHDLSDTYNLSPASLIWLASKVWPRGAVPVAHVLCQLVTGLPSVHCE